MTLRVVPLSPGFGAEAVGVDLAQPLSESAFRAIEEAFFAAQVLVLRAQNLTAAQFLAFARRFGPPEPHVIDQFHHPEHADILILSNVVRDGKPAGLADAAAHMATNLIGLASRAHVVVARDATDDLLADALHFLRSPLELLFGRLPAECAHLGSSGRGRRSRRPS